MRVFLLTQLLLAIAVVPVWLLSRSRVAPLAALHVARALLVAALLLPWVPWLAPADLNVPVQVYSRTTHEGTVVRASVAERRLEVTAPTMRRVSGTWMIGIGLVLAMTGLGLGALHFRLNRTRRIRRFGRVEVRLGPTPTPYAMWWPGTSLVVLDPSTHGSSTRGMAIAHELQHHRHGDTRWAWALIGLRVLFPFNPAVWLWPSAMRELEELAVDAAMLQRFPRKAYAHCLIDTAAHAAHLTPALAAKSSALHRRITMLHHTPRPAALAIMALTLGLGTLSATAIAGNTVFVTSDAEVQTIARRASYGNFDASNHPLVAQRLRDLTQTSNGRRFVGPALDRQTKHRKRVSQAIKDWNAPPQLAAIPLIESGYRNLGYYTSGESAAPGTPGKGLWMFIPATARHYGLEVTETNDERLDLQLETEAAMHLLSDLHAQFGDWPLAIAAYNMGPKAVTKAIAKHHTRDAFELMELGALNDYTASVYAAVLIMEDPEAFGF
jgi:membrane-bound lytic murein transglycosylase D